MSGELAAIEWLRQLLPAPPGEVGIGDDAAVAPRAEEPFSLLAVDSVVAGVHVDVGSLGLDTLGWKALVANLSDVAAMGGRPARCVVSVAGAAESDLPELYRGLLEASVAYDCPIVGGDLSSAPGLVVTVAVTGTSDGPPVLRSGARPGDTVWTTGPLGASAAGLRLLRAEREAPGAEQDALGGRGVGVAGVPAPGLGGAGRGAPTQSPSGGQRGEPRTPQEAHRRPLPLLGEGVAARTAGATAMIDVSDGFSSELWQLSAASSIRIELDEVPIAAGATLEEALGGGEDYQLLFSAPDPSAVLAAFAGLPAPVPIGVCRSGGPGVSWGGRPLPRRGWEHRL